MLVTPVWELCPSSPPCFAPGYYKVYKVISTLTKSIDNGCRKHDFSRYFITCSTRWPLGCSFRQSWHNLKDIIKNPKEINVLFPSCKKLTLRPLPYTTYKTVGVIEKAMLGTSHSFFLLHLFQVIIVLDVLTGSQWQDGDSKTGDWVAGVAERAEEPACSVANVRARKIQGVAEKSGEMGL